jgi:hypothetical protein
MKRMTGVFATLLVVMLAVPSAHAFNSARYKELATETARKILSGNVDVDALIKVQNELIKMGVDGCREHAKMMPKDAKMMQLVVDNADKMKHLTLDEIDDEWHDGEFLRKNGIDFDSMDHMGPSATIMFTVVHPATAYIALTEYKKTGDREYLMKAKDEMSEVLEHIDFIKKHLKMMQH